MGVLAFVVLAAVAGLAQARPEYSYGAPASDPSHGSGSSGYNYNQAPLVTKHVYVHVAPEEPEAPRAARVLAPGPARKHYKIVFIKAPSPPAPTGATVQLPAPDEEKTLIYVLHKRPEDQAEISIQPAAPTTPAKPEVYFIKYRAQKAAAPATSYGAPVAAAVPAAPAASYGAPASSSY